MQPIAARVDAEEPIAHALMRGRHKRRAHIVITKECLPAMRTLA
jgi:hypothetical protein